MRWILGLLGALFGSVVGDEEGLVGGAALGLLIGWLIERERARVAALQKPGGGVATTTAQSFEQRASARLAELSRRVEALERTVAELRAAGSSALSAPASEPGALPVAQVLDDRGYPTDVPAAAQPVQVAQPSAENLSYRELYEQQEEEALRVEAPREPPAVAEPRAPVEPLPGAATLEALRSFFLGGNTVVRIGILVLTVGVGLLVKYAADADYFPLELRLALAAAIGLSLVVFGFTQRSTRPGFSTALQGGGVAAMYLVTFFAYYAYQLLPAALTMALLIGLAAFSSVLAVVQNAQQLAVIGAIGAFLSPVLASSGGGSHSALFSYYALLNVAICGIAVFRSWRILNWTGFLFTFGIGSAWGALQFKPENMLRASLFLLLFFLLYVVDGTLFALRQADGKRGTIDTTLTFGTPLATLALAGGLFHDQHPYLALACLLIASVYIGLATTLTLARDSALAALSRAYIAVGIGVATLAIPFALDDALGTALAWAAEASGLVWVGIRQQRLRTRVAGYLLFAASLLSLLVHEGETATPARALFGGLIALGFGFAAARIEQAEATLTRPERYVGGSLLTFGLFVWTAACAALIESCLPLELRPTGWLLAIAGTTLALELLGGRFEFHAARSVATFAFPVLLLGSLGPLASTESHLFAHFGWLGLSLASAAAYAALFRNEAALREHPGRADALHASAALLFALVLFIEARYLSASTLGLAAGWSVGASLLAPLLVVGVALSNEPSWPVATHTRGYLRWAAWPLVLTLSALSLLLHAVSDGSAAPLPYLPLLNPFDLSQALLIALLLLVARTEPVRSARTSRIAAWLATLLGFVGLSGTVVRAAHYWAELPFVEFEVPRAPVVQASFSILWTTLALIAMLLAHRRRERGMWAAGAVLLAAVVVKLFFIDLGNLGGVAKIVTFLAVGLLLLLIGYFAPVPPTKRTLGPPPDPAPEPTVANSEERS